MLVKHLGLCDYQQVFSAMQQFTQQRGLTTEDQLWFCQHFPVFTQGIAGKESHILTTNDIPVVQSNRGGQVTYHAPGQIVVYPLLDLRRKDFLIKGYVNRLEQGIIDTLAKFNIQGIRVAKAPGVYVRLSNNYTADSLLDDNRFIGLAKIAALGVKVANSCTYHGLALNVCMDLTPFGYINPCGYSGLKTIDMTQLKVQVTLEEVVQVLQQQLVKQLG